MGSTIIGDGLTILALDGSRGGDIGVGLTIIGDGLTIWLRVGCGAADSAWG